MSRRSAPRSRRVGLASALVFQLLALSSAQAAEDPVDARWSALLLRDAGSEAEAQAFLALLQARQEAGYRSLPARAYVVMQMADERLLAGDPAGARRYAEWAAQLDPTSPQPEFLTARSIARQRPWAAVEIATAVRAGYGRLLDSVSGAGALRVNGTRRAVAAAVLLAAGLCVAFVVRHGTCAVHDTRLALRRGVSLNQAAALLTLLVVVAGVVAWSPALVLLGGLSVVAPYLRAGERALALCVAAGMSAAPWVAETYASALTSNAVEASVPARAIEGPCDARCADVLQRRAGLGDPAARVAQAWVAFRSTPDDERGTPSALMDRLPAEGALGASSEVLRGHIAYAAHDLDAAEDAYRRAHDAAVGRVQRGAALFGLYRVLLEREDAGAAQIALAGALQEDQAALSLHQRYRGRDLDALLPSVPIPAVETARALAEENDAAIAATARAVLALWTGTLSAGTYSVLVAAASLWLVASIAVRRRGTASMRCEACGTPVSRRIYEPAFAARRCVLCYQLLAARRDLTADQIDARQGRIDVWRAMAPQLALAADLAVPGLGMMASGATIAGAATLVCAAVGAVAVTSVGWGALPYAPPATRAFDGIVPAGAVLLVLSYVAVAIAAWARRQTKEGAR